MGGASGGPHIFSSRQDPKQIPGGFFLFWGLEVLNWKLLPWAVEKPGKTPYN
jgi:hypothetical protein